MRSTSRCIQEKFLISSLMGTIPEHSTEPTSRMEQENGTSTKATSSTLSQTKIIFPSTSKHPAETMSGADSLRYILQLQNSTQEILFMDLIARLLNNILFPASKALSISTPHFMFRAT